MYDKRLSDLTFTVVDTETTGLSHRYAGLVEIAAVRVLPGLVIDMRQTFSQLVNPGRPISYDCYKIHGISNEMVADKPDIATVVPIFSDFCKETVLAAHNAPFDMGFLNAAFRKAGITPTFGAVVDTIAMARKAFPQAGGYSLDNMIKFLDLYAEVPEGGRHRALYDAAHTALLLVRCIERLESMGIKYIRDI